MTRAPGKPMYRAAFDHELKRRFLNFMKTCGLRGLDTLEIQVMQGVVRIRGTLLSVSDRWLCIESCRRLFGVSKVIDEVVVAPAAI